MTRRQLRENVFKLLFMENFHSKEEYEETAALFMDSLDELTPEDRDVVKERAENVICHLPEIDEALAAASKGWKLDRMGKAELSILRLAYYEIKLDEEIPQNVAINEAVLLAKKYADDASGSFVNGILAKIVD